MIKIPSNKENKYKKKIILKNKQTKKKYFLPSLQ